MSIEPHNARFQIGTRVMPAETKTLDQYRAAIIAKYGRMPHPQELAGMEADKTGCKIHENSTVKRELTEKERAALNRYRVIQAAKTNRSIKLILDHLTEPMTTAQLEPLVKMTRQRIGALLWAALQAGRATRTAPSHKKGAIWSRVDD